MTTVNSHERKKEPERVRRALLDATASLASEKGFAAVTIDAVAKAAGVTKGGLFHHFPGKEALFRGALMDLIERFDAAIDAAMTADPHLSGRFTRAYVKTIFNQHREADDNRLAALTLSMLAVPDLQRCWAQWLGSRLERQGEHDSDVRFEIVRLAVDGVWLALLMPNAALPIDFAAVRNGLLTQAAPVPGAEMDVSVQLED